MQHHPERAEMSEALTQRDLQTLEWLTVRELAERWKVTPDTIRRWCADGELKGMMIGSSLRIHRSEIEHHEASGIRVKAKAIVKGLRKWRSAKPVPDVIGARLAQRKVVS
jgi:excisionase family DNA binding protein